MSGQAAPYLPVASQLSEAASLRPMHLTDDSLGDIDRVCEAFACNLCERSLPPPALMTRFLCIVILGLLAACQPRPESTASDGPVTLAETEVRIVSVVPSTTEMLFAIGAGDSVVGRSAHCNYPEEVAELTPVGSGFDPDLETIFALKATRVVGTEMQAGADWIATLENAGVEVLLVPDIELDDVTEALTMLGEMTGREQEAAAVVADFEESIAGTTMVYEDRGPAPRVLMVVGHDPLYASGPESRIGEMIANLGGDNVLSSGDWVQLDDESLLQRAPQVIVQTSGLDEAMWQRFPELPAVEFGRICEVNGDAIARPGPRMAQAYAQLGACIWGAGE